MKGQRIWVCQVNINLWNKTVSLSSFFFNTKTIKKRIWRKNDLRKTAPSQEPNSFPESLLTVLHACPYIQWFCRPMLHHLFLIKGHRTDVQIMRKGKSMVFSYLTFCNSNRMMLFFFAFIWLSYHTNNSKIIVTHINTYWASKW